VYGNPGCGKSVLASSIVDYLKEAEKETKKPVFYFFCKNDNVDKNSSLAILRSLLSQLLLWAPGLVAHVEESFHKSGKTQIDSFYSLLPGFLTCLANAQTEFVAKGGDDSNDEIHGYIVIDGIDECDESVVADLCSAIKLWFEAHASTQFGLLFTSRHSQHIGDELGEILPYGNSFGGWSYHLKKMSYRMSSYDTKDYIPGYVRAGVARSRSLKAAVAAGLDVSDVIIKASAGHWLYARLALEDAMRQPTLGLLKQNLLNMPGDLSKLYSKILVERQRLLDENEVRMAKIIFEWVCVARIPRPLSVSDISTLLGVKPGQTQLNTDDTPLDCDGLIQRLCAPLLEVDGQQRVAVTHQSVKEYIYQASRGKSDASNNVPYLISSIYEITLSLAYTSMSFVLLEDVQKFFTNRPTSPSYKQIDEEFPLLQQVILPVWDWYGNYAFQAGQAYLENSVSLEPHETSIHRLSQFLTSPQNLPWITTTLQTYGQHDLSVLFTRTALCVALSRDTDVPKDKAHIWTTLFPNSLEPWITDFEALAKRLNWRFRFYEVVRNSNSSSDDVAKAVEMSDGGRLGTYSSEVSHFLGKWSFPDYASYDDNGIHFCGREENEQKVTAIIDKALESLVNHENAGLESSMRKRGEIASESEADIADEFALRLLPNLNNIKNIEKSRTFSQARRLFRAGEWDLWSFSFKTGNIHRRLGAIAGTESSEPS
jgi:hypothetical protein